jgi:hypothetical protein
MSNDNAIAVDVAKNVFQVGISDRPGGSGKRSASNERSSCPSLPRSPRVRW